VNDSIINLLVEDCNVHGKALETLAEILKKIDNINDCNISRLMERLHDEFISEYDKAFSFASDG
jgi:hypothetical protein